MPWCVGLAHSAPLLVRWKACSCHNTISSKETARHSSCSLQFSVSNWSNTASTLPFLSQPLISCRPFLKDHSQVWPPGWLLLNLDIHGRHWVDHLQYLGYRNCLKLCLILNSFYFWLIFKLYYITPCLSSQSDFDNIRYELNISNSIIYFLTCGGVNWLLEIPLRGIP